MALADTGTLLVITPLSGSSAAQLAPFSARNLTQTLSQISGNSMSGGNVLGTNIVETVDGRTIDLTPSWMRKYQSTITCTDFNTPVLDDAFRGLEVEVQCVYELSYWSGGAPTRPSVSGSERVNGNVTYYRPVLQMMVIDIRGSKQEWPDTYNWQIDLRELRVPS